MNLIEIIETLKTLTEQTANTEGDRTKVALAEAYRLLTTHSRRIEYDEMYLAQTK